MDSTRKATFVASALRMLKERLDRLPDDTSRDEYFTARIEQTIEELEQVRAEKAAERGGFEKRILLKEIRDPAENG